MSTHRPIPDTDCIACEGSGYTDHGVPDSPEGPGSFPVSCIKCNGTGWRNGVHLSDQKSRTSTTSNTFMQQFDDCRDLIGRIKAVMDSAPRPQWLLMGPDGRVWQGSQQDVARVLLRDIDIAALLTSPATK